MGGDASGGDGRRSADLNACRGERGRDGGHGLGAASLVAVPPLCTGPAPVSIVASTDMPGLTSAPSEGLLSNTIFTGTRWTTLVKFPVALSGGSSAKVLPVPVDQLSTWPVSLRSGKASTATLAGWPIRTSVIWVSL